VSGIYLVNKIPKFSGQKEEIQFEEFVRRIEAYADFVGWTNDEQGENEEICFLFRTKFDGKKADGIWRFTEEEDKININIWKDVKNQIQE
jgi:hypothetical protein